MRRAVSACILLAMAASASAAVQLDISSGFNMDAWCGAKEFQVLRTQGCDLGELQGGNALGVGWYVLGQQNMMVGNTTETGFGQAYSTEADWNHPVWASGNTGTPEDGVLTGADRVYHIASHLGNATLPGDWLEVENPAGTWLPSKPEVRMASKPNAMVVASGHNKTSFQIAEVIAALPVEQQAAYTDINFVIGGWNQADPNRFTRIFAVYADGTEDLLYSFTDNDGGQAPVVANSKVIALGAEDFVPVYGFTHNYNSSSGTTGNIGAFAGTLYEFAEPLELDSTKVLAAIKMIDNSPGTNWNARGTSIFAATAIPEPATLALLGLGALGLIRRRR